MTRALLGAAYALLFFVTLAGAQTKSTTISGCVVRDAGNGGHATITTNGISYRLAGKRDKELAPYLGKRVEVTGTIDAEAIGTSGATGAAPPKDQTATGGQADVPATDTPRDNTIPLATAQGTTADLTATVQVKSIRIVSPNCLTAPVR